MNVTYLDHMGSDLTVVNAARVSFNKQKDTLDDSDIRLLNYLARGMTNTEFNNFALQLVDTNDIQEIKHLLLEFKRTPTHFAPFCHPQLSVQVEAPIFVARQLAKHQVGLAWSEISRRYVTDEPQFWNTLYWRERPEDIKQGSAGLSLYHYASTASMNRINEDGLSNYQHLLNLEACPEQARAALPQSTYTQWIWTGSLFAFSRVYNLRRDAQKETAQIAVRIGQIIQPLFPISWEALTQ